MKQFKLTFLVVALMMILSNFGWGQTTIGFNGAETSGTTWTTSSNTFTTSPTNTGTPADRIKNGTQSYQKSGGFASLITNSISTTGYSNCFVEIWNASISVTTGNGIDAADNIKIYLSQTNTFSGTSDISIFGNTNARFGMSGTGNVTTTAGTQTIFTYPGGGTLTGTNAKSKLIVNVPSGWTTVYLKIEATNDDANEIWCIDDISLKGTVSSTPTQLAITSITPTSPTAGSGFNVTVQSQDGSNVAANVTANTGFDLTSNGNAGTIAGTTTGTILAGTNSITVSGVILPTAGSLVTLTATRNSGDILNAGTSSTFSVLAAADHLAYVSFPTTGNVGVNIATFTVEARRPDNTVDNTYTGNIVITKATGSGTLAGTTTKAAVSGVATFNDLQFNAADSYTLYANSSTFSQITSGSIVISIANATSNLFKQNSTWLTAANWTNGTVPTSSENAQIGSNIPSPDLGINMNGTTNNGTSNQIVGSIEIISTRSASCFLGNSSSSVNGILTLAGVVVNSVQNVILRNNSAQVLTIQNLANGSTGVTMGLALGNSTDNVVNIDGSGNIAISSIISGASKNLTVKGSGSGILILSGANSFTGLTTVTSGTLQLNKTGGTTIPSTNNVTINGGSLKISSNQTISNLTMSSGSLIVDAGVTLTVTGTYNVTGGTINNLGKIKLNGGSVSFPGSGVTVNNGTAGTLTDLEIATTSGDVTLTAGFNVSGTLTLTSGKVITGANTLTLGTGTGTLGTLSGGSSTSYIFGNFERWFVSGATVTNVFPLGTSTKYRPATITYTIAPTTGGKLNVSTNDNSTSNNPTFPQDGGVDFDRISEALWSFTPTALDGGTYDINFQANGIGGVDATLFTNLRIMKRTDNLSNWAFVGSHVAAIPPIPNSLNPVKPVL